jgi:hypothetical protein
MGDSRRSALAKIGLPLIVGVNVIQHWEEISNSIFGQDSQTQGQDPNTGTDSGNGREDRVLYQETQNVLLQPGQAFSEVFTNDGQNTLRVQLTGFSDAGMNAFAGLYTFAGWQEFERDLEDGGGHEYDPLEHISTSERNVQEFNISGDREYAIVLYLSKALSTPEPQNVKIDYSIVD